MKKKLFAVAMLVSVYALFALIFTALNGQENVSLTDVGLSNATAQTALQLQPSQTDSDIKLKASFRDPMPPPINKPSKRP